MKKNVFGRKLKRDKNERTALFKGLMSSLVLYGKITTTEAKAKSIKGEVDKLVTRARKDTLLARKLLAPHLSAAALDKFISDVAPNFKDRNSGFTKIVKLGRRFKDNAPLVLMSWTDEIQIKNEKLKVKNSKTKGSSKSKKVKEVSRVARAKTKTTRTRKKKV